MLKVEPKATIEATRILIPAVGRVSADIALILSTTSAPLIVVGLFVKDGAPESPH